MLIRIYRIASEAFYRFNGDDGWAIASHIALSTLMAMFPFLLVLTAIAGLFGSKNLADESVRILLEVWPEQVAAPLGLEIRSVLASAQGGVLTVGGALALYFASAGIEGLRVGLNRAYATEDTRRWFWMRLESIAYVIIGAFGLLALAFLVFLAPLIWATAVKYLPQLAPFGNVITFTRLTIAATVLIIALFVVHLWLPAGRRSLAEIFPGIVVTIILWLVAGSLFGRYLADFAFTYSTYYAGLASPMIALVFLYLTASIFIYGAEINDVIARPERQRIGFSLRVPITTPPANDDELPKA